MTRRSVFMRLAAAVPLALTAALLAFTLALAVVLGGAVGAPERHEPDRWAVFGGGPEGTFFEPTPSARFASEYELVHLGTLPGVEPPTYACAFRDSSTPQIVTTTSRHEDGMWRYATRIVSDMNCAEAESLPGPTLLCPFRHGPDYELALLLSSVNMQYSSEPDPHGRTPTDLFLVNFSKEHDYDRPKRFMRATIAASRAETLRVTNSIFALNAELDTIFSLAIPAKHTICSGSVFGAGPGGLAVLASDDGIQDSELSYILVDQPRLKEQEVGWSKDKDRSYISFRGLVAVDIAEQRMAWERRLGVSPWPRVAGDINGDGRLEIIVYTYSPYNRVNGGGTTDAACGYVLCLDEFGNELWRHRFTGAYLGTQAALADVTGDGELEVIALAGSRKDDRVGAIAVLSSSGEVLSKADEFGGVSGLVLADLDGDGISEIVVGDCDGRVLALDGELELVASFSDTAHSRYLQRRAAPLVANDIDGDGDVEVIALSVGWSLPFWRPRGIGKIVTYDPRSYVYVLGPDLAIETASRVPASPNGHPVQHWGGTMPSNSMVVDLNDDGVHEFVLTRRRSGAYFYGIEKRAES